MFSLRKVSDKFNFKTRWYCLLVGIIGFFTVGVYYGLTNQSDGLNSPKTNYCKSQNNAENEMFNLRTKLSVTYESSHWFHMAENFLVQHSILRENGRQSCQNRIFYNFDNSKFIQSLNGVTKFMIVLGTFQLPTERVNCKLSKSYSFYFTHVNQNLFKNHNIISTNGYDDQNLKISKNSLKDLQIETISPDVPTERRFITHQTSFSPDESDYTDEISILSGRRLDIHNKEKFLRNNHDFSKVIVNNDICVHNKGIIGGGWPTIQRGHWFPNIDDVKSFRQKIAYLCPRDDNLLQKHKKSKPYKLVIYQRDLSRKLIDQEDSIRLLQEKLLPNEWEIVVIMHKKDRSPCEIAHLLNNVDVLVTPHGFQSMLLLFMRRPSVLFEIFPYRYYKRAYGPLSKEYGVIHGGVMSESLSWLNSMILSHIQTKWCMGNKYCRGYARNTNVKLTKHGVNRLFELIQFYLSTIIENKLNSEGIDSLYTI